MSLAGQIAAGQPETTDLRELLLAFAATRRTGLLRVRAGIRQAFVVFQRGELVFVGLDGPDVLRESLGSVLVNLDLLSGETLEEAIRDQRRYEGDWRLGTFLLAWGMVREEELRLALREQMRPAVSRILGWKRGLYEFEPLVLRDRGEIPIPLGELITREGASEPLGPWGDLVPGPVLHPTVTSLSELLARLRGPSLHGEVLLLILRQAASVLDRGAVFLCSAGTISGIGWFGGERAKKERIAVRGLEIGTGESAFITSLTCRDTALKGALTEAPFDRRFGELLGGPTPTRSIIAPLPRRGNAPLVLYGDNALTGDELAGTKEVLAAMQQAGNLLSLTAWH
jgi:hypothetical protein